MALSPVILDSKPKFIKSNKAFIFSELYNIKEVFDDGNGNKDIITMLGTLWIFKRKKSVSGRVITLMHDPLLTKPNENYKCEGQCQVYLHLCMWFVAMVSMY